MRLTVNHTAVIATLALVSIVVAAFAFNIGGSPALSEQDMRDAFSCDRNTREGLQTDIYCGDYELYVSHVEFAQTVSNEDLSKYLKCGRLSLDARFSDKYCTNKSLFIEETINGSAAWLYKGSFDPYGGYLPL